MNSNFEVALPEAHGCPREIGLLSVDAPPLGGADKDSANCAGSYP
ncbi:hypothetical protein QM716_11230 [Rhodococcus sp. IEGM 1409]|nr:hypothetical protein [Rhodococcus sp. IEGM 1409]MDI9900427.1 hypothetical protein [Rhodococcus sp. IEGM 1409]